MSFGTSGRAPVAAALAACILAFSPAALGAFLIGTQDDATPAVVVANDSGTSRGFFPKNGPTLEEVTVVRVSGGGVYVADSTATGGVVHRYTHDGQFVATIIAPGSNVINDISDMVFGPNGDLFVATYDTALPSGDGGQVLRYTADGVFVGIAAANGAGDGTNAALSEPMAITFGPDGNLYVANSDSGTEDVLRFNGTTGAFIDTFIPNGATGLSDPKSIKFGPDGRFYATNEGNDSVEVFNGTTGAYIGTFVTSGSGGLNEPMDMVFAGNSLFVLSGDDGSEAVHRYDAATGAFISTALLTPNVTFEDARSLVIASISEPIPLFGLPVLIVLALSLLGLGALGLRKTGAASAA